MRIADDARGEAEGVGQEKDSAGRDLVKAESPEESAHEQKNAVAAAAAAAARHEQSLQMQVAQAPAM